MAKSPYRRQSRRLLSLAGRADRASEQPVLELLEERRLLTTLTVPDADSPLGPALDADGYPEAVFFTWYAQPALTYEPDTEVASLAIGVRFVLSGTPGASVEIKDLFGRDLYFRPTAESLAPPRATFEAILESPDGNLGPDGYEFAPSGSAAYATDPDDAVGARTDSIESVVGDLNGDGLADIITVNAAGPNAVTWQFGLGEAESIDDDTGEVTPAEPDGTFGDLENEVDGAPVPAQQAITYMQFGPAGASGLAVADLTGDEFPEIIVTYRDTDNVAIYENLGEELVDPDSEEYNWLGFGPATLVDVGDQPIDVGIDDKGDIWVLNYGDETVQRVTTAKTSRDVFTISGSLSDVTLIDADNDGVGDGIGNNGDDTIVVGRGGGETGRGVLTFRLPQTLLDAVTANPDQFVTRVTLLMGGQEPDPDTGYNLNLFMTSETLANGTVVIGDFDDDGKFDTRIDTDTNAFLTPASDNLDDQGEVYQFPYGKLSIEMLQDAAGNGNHFLQFRMDGDHRLFGTDESLLTPDELAELDALSPYRLNAADMGLTETIPTLTITLSETFQGDDIYAVGSEPTSLLMQQAHGAAPADPDDPGTPDMVVTHAGSDDVWVFFGQPDPGGDDKYIFGLDDGDGDGSRDPNYMLSTQRPVFFNAIADMDGDGIVDPIADDSNPAAVAVGDIDLDGTLDIALALKGNMYPGISVFTSNGTELANTLIPGGVAVFWGLDSNLPGADPYVDSDLNRPDTQPDFLQDTFLGNQPTPFLTQGFTSGATLRALELDPFYRGPASIEIGNVDPHVDFRMNETYAALDLVVGSIDPYNAVTNPDHAFFNFAATRGGVYTMVQRHDAQSEYAGFTYASYASPATTPQADLNSPLIGIDRSTIIPGRVFNLPIEHDTAKNDYFVQAPDLPAIPYIDVLLADLEPTALDTPLLDEEVPVLDIVMTRPDNESPYWLQGEDPSIARNVQVLWQIEGEADPLPLYNYGIGSIEFTGADQYTRLTVTAGSINVSLTENDAYLLEPGFRGHIADFEMWDPLVIEDGPENLEDLEGSGAIRIGAPSVRPFTVNALNFYADYSASYTQPTQGIKAKGGQSVDRIVIDGHVYGRNILDGSIETFSAGFLAGDLIIAGDAGLINIATNSGFHSRGETDGGDQKEDAYLFNSTGQNLTPAIHSGNIIEVGRTLRELNVGRVLYSQVTVLGEVGDLEERPALDALRVVESEAVHSGGDLTIQVDPASGRQRAYTANSYSYHRGPGMAMQGSANALHFGDPLAGDSQRRGMTLYTDGGVPLTNDTVGSAQFVGGTTTAVEVAGWLNNAAGDTTDYYSFAATGGETVSLSYYNEQVSSQDQILRGQPVVTVEDREGNILATMEAGRIHFDFTAPYTGVFFLSLGASATVTTVPYTLQMQGLAPVTLGQVRSGSAMILLGSAAIETKGGSIGYITSGQATEDAGIGVEGIDGADAEDVASILGAQLDGDIDNLVGGFDGVTSAGNIYGITAGGDIAGVTFNAPGHIGMVMAGYSLFVDDGNEGDFWDSFIQAGSLGYMNITGSFATETDAVDDDEPKGASAGIEVDGSIGTVHIGEHLRGTSAFFTIGDRSSFDQLIVDAYTRGEDDGEPQVLDSLEALETPLDGIIGSNPVITTGTGSDIRFIDAPNSLFNDVPGSFAVVLDEFTSHVTFTDDAGGDVTIRLAGATETSGARVYFMEIDGSEGVAVSRIDAVLLDGANLVIENNRQDSVASIGRIRVNSASEETKIEIRGRGEVDVYRIEGFASDAGDGGGTNSLGLIRNDTPGGDIVSIDVAGLDQLDIRHGDLGRTQTNGVGLERLSAWIGLNADGVTEAPGGTIYVRDTGNLLVAPFDAWLDGLIVRTGDVETVKLAGAAGDVIVEAGTLHRLTVNSDNKIPVNGFDGIIGSVYADVIDRVDIGSGLMGPGESSLARAGIFADGYIDRITGSGAGNDLAGLVIATGADVGDDQGQGAPGQPLEDRFQDIAINRIELKSGASIVGANIGGMNLSDWFLNPLGGTQFQYTEDIGRITVKGGGDIFGTQIRAANVGRIDVSQGAWDASVLEVRNDLDSLRAGRFTNSLVNGRMDESPHNPLDLVTYFAPDTANPLGSQIIQDTLKYSNFVRVSGNADTIQTKGSGDIHDLVMEVGGDLTKFAGNNLVRVDLGVSGRLQRLDAKGSLLASDILAGNIDRISAKDSIRTTAVETAGPIDRVEAKRGEIYNSLIRSDGTDGQIGRISAKERLQNVQIDSAGPIQLVQAKTGDVNVRLTTFGNGQAHLQTVKAGRDIRGTYDVDGDIYTFSAKENVGTDPALLPAGADAEFIIATQDLNQIDARNGQIYAEIRVQGAQTGTVRIGDVVTRDGVTMSPSTASYVFAGTVNNFQSKGAFDATIESQAGGIGSLSFQGDVGATAQFLAFDGGINRLSIKGTFAGAAYADEDIDSFTVTGTSSGASVRSDQTLKNVTFSGATDTTFVHAGQTINSFNARSSLSTTTVGAGELIHQATVSGLATDVNFVAGLESLGADGVLGGGDDLISSGDIDDLNLAGGSTRVNVLAGWDVGVDGAVDPLAAPNDDAVANGLSRVHKMSAGGVITNSFLRADTFAPAVGGFDRLAEFSDEDPAPTANAIRSGQSQEFIFSVTDPDGGGPATLVLNIAYSGAGFVEPTFTDMTGNGFTGDDRLSALNIYGADGRSALTVSSRLVVAGQEDRTGFAHLGLDPAGFNVIGAEDESFGTLTWDGDLTGNAGLSFDGAVSALAVGDIDSGGTLTFADALDSLQATGFQSGTLAAREIGSATILSGFGGDITAQHFGSINAGGVWTGLLSVDENISSVTAGAFRGTVRAGGNVDRFTATSANTAVVSAGDDLGQMRVTGNANALSFVAGLDVGADGWYGGGDDVLSNGDVKSVTIGGNFTRGNVVAGISRGADGFFGTSDDSYAPGVSRIGPVSIAGFQVGSNLGTETYGVMATGEVGNVIVDGAPTGGQQNFHVMGVDTSVLPLSIENIRTELDGDSYTTYITFDQHVNTGTISSAFTITNPSLDTPTLVEGTDYVLSYDEDTMTIEVAFAAHVGQSFHEYDLSSVGNLQPGVYTIGIEADPAAGGLLSRTGRSYLDGDGDGFSSGDAGEADFSRGVLVGDAGDRASQSIISLDVNETPIDPFDDFWATLYSPVNLTANNMLPLNEVTSLTGTIGNHPDQDVLLHPAHLDADVFTITAQAGDVIRVNTVFAEGLFSYTLRTADDYPIDTVESNDIDALSSWDYSTRVDTGELGTRATGVGDLETGIVIQEDGVYYLTIASSDVANLFPNLPPTMFSHGIINYPFFLGNPGVSDVGDYEVEILHFRDGDTGFLDVPPIGAPTLIGTPLDTAAGTQTVDSAIGFAGSMGVPNELLHDSDVYLLNNGVALPAGSVVDISLLLSELGADLESSTAGQSASPAFDSSGVELAVFDVTAATGFGDAVLIAAPTINAQGDRLTGDSDFSYQITLPGDPNANPGDSSSDRIYAIMVQGNQQSDYRLQVTVSNGNGQTPATNGGQNVVIETNGGSIDWLESYGETTLDGFDLGVLGMKGQEALVLGLLLDGLETIYSGYDITFATSSAAFEGEDFTTVFLTSSFAPDAFRDPIEYGYNDGVDVFNANKNQEAVMFLPKYSTVFSVAVDGALEPVPLMLGLEEQLATALSNTIAKELGETFGLREMDSVAADYANPNQVPQPPDGFNNDSIMTENASWAWADALMNWSPDLAFADSQVQLDMGEFLLGSANSIHSLGYALARN